MAVEVVSCVLLVLVVVLWSLARRRPEARAMGLALLALTVTSGVLVVSVAGARRPLAPCALTVTMTIALIGLADLFPGGEPPGHDDGEDYRGGGGDWPFEPIHPGGGGLPHPDPWEQFEDAFWAHVSSERLERVPAHTGRPAGEGS